MPNTTTRVPTAAAEDVPFPAASIDQARAAWVTAPRDAELDRWNALYDVAVPAPPPQMTIWERYEAGWPARGADERARYRELDQCSPRPGADPEAGQ